MKGEVAGVPAGVVVGLRRLGVATVYEAGRRREDDEAAMMDELRAGALTLDLMGPRGRLGDGDG